MKFVPQLQSQLAINKQRIREIEDEIADARANKSYADKHGFQEAEYHNHNYLKRFRAELKNYVRIQKTLKQLIKEL